MPNYVLFCYLTILISSTNAANNKTDLQTFKPLPKDTQTIINKYLNTDRTDSSQQVLHNLEQEFLKYLKLFLESTEVEVSNGVVVRKVKEIGNNAVDGDTPQDLIIKSIIDFAKSHVVNVRLGDVISDFRQRIDEVSNDISERSTGKLFGGKSSFLTGFGLGFLAFGLKKLMLPFFIGAQIFKSILLAMFLPTILTTVRNVVGKGVSNFASSSGGLSGLSGLSGGHNAAGQMEDFDFKDNAGYDSDSSVDGSSPVFSYALPGNNFDHSFSKYPPGVLPAPNPPSLSNRYTPSSQRVNYLPNTHNHGSFYTKNNKKQQDFKVFHNIPSSSLLLTNYDPFYSPLLSRIDSVFTQLGYSTEACRERLVCFMYKNPAKYAPYSNLISAQLSRELNELRKPSTDNPDILRFFKYMKAAKDGQDDIECSKVYASCNDNRESVNPPMVKTYNEINKLVHARKLFRR